MRPITGIMIRVGSFHRTVRDGTLRVVARAGPNRSPVISGPQGRPGGAQPASLRLLGYGRAHCGRPPGRKTVTVNPFSKPDPDENVALNLPVNSRLGRP